MKLPIPFKNCHPDPELAEGEGPAFFSRPAKQILPSEKLPLHNRQLVLSHRRSFDLIGKHES